MMHKKSSFTISFIFLMVWNISFGQVPVIQSFSPTTGPVGTTVTITGTNFSSTPSNNIVFFGAARGTVISTTPNSLTVTVPSAATYQPITVTVNGLTTSSRNPFVVTFSGDHGINTSSISRAGGISTGGMSNSTMSLLWQGDFDADGKVDLAGHTFEPNYFSIFRNTGSGPGNFSYEKTSITTEAYTRQISVADLDGDGKPEVVSASERILSVFHNTSNGPGNITFTRYDFATSWSTAVIGISDLDGDGRLDVAVGTSASQTVLHRNISSGPGNINFSLVATVGAVPHSEMVAISDLNGDGKGDLVTLSDSGSETVSINQNVSTGPGDLNFAARQTYDAQGWRKQVAIGDLDGDGKPDLLLAGETTYFSVYLNNSSASTTSLDPTQIKIGLGPSPRSISVGDIDGDGKIDVAIDVSSQLYLFRNVSTGPGNVAFEPVVPFAPSEGGIAIGDQDGDGKPDLAFFNGAGLGLWRNRISGKFDQSITFATLPSKKYGDAEFTLTATSSSGLPVTYSSSDESKATVSGNTVTIKAPGSVIITATQAGDDSYEPAGEMSRELTILKADQSIDFQTIAAKTLGDGPFSLVAAASSGLPIQFTSPSDKVSVNGDQVSILKVGSATITAAQNGNDYHSAVQNAQSFCINPSKPIINVFDSSTGATLLTSSSSLGNQWYKDGSAIPDAVSNIYVTTETGTYTVKVTIDNCSSEFSTEASLIITGISETITSNLLLYPNPASSRLTIDLSGFSDNGEVQIIIYDQSGRLIEKQFKRKGKTNISVSSYSPGIYFVLATQQGKKFISTFIKE